MKIKRILILPLLMILAGAVFAACGSDSPSGEEATGSGPDPVVTEVWARSTAPGQNTGAIYATIEGGDRSDRLIGVSVPGSVAGTAELHESTGGNGDHMEGDHDSGTGTGHGSSEGHGGHMDASGTMTMKQLHRIEIPANGQVGLEPGGKHIMLMELAGPLKAGDVIPVTLTFERAGTVQADAEVRDH